MSCSRFSISQAYAYAFSTVFNNFWQFLKLILLQVLALIGIALMGGSVAALGHHIAAKQNPAIIVGIFLTLIVAMLAKNFFRLSYLRACLDVHDYTRYELKNIWVSWRLVWSSMVATCIFTLLFYLGLLALIIPGLIVGIAYSWYEWVIVDKQLSGWQSLKESARLTKGCRFKLLFFQILTVTVVIVGLPFLALGLPISSMASAYVYRRLQALPVKTSNVSEELVTS